MLLYTSIDFHRVGIAQRLVQPAAISRVLVNVRCCMTHLLQPWSNQLGIVAGAVGSA